MGTFSASLRATGDVRSLAATVELSDGSLSIRAGDTEIGSWPLSEIQLEEMPTGYRMAAEGEQILIELNDVGSFADELEASKARRHRRGRQKKPVREKVEPYREVPTRSVSGARTSPGNEDQLADRKSLKVAPDTSTDRSERTGKGLSLVDGTLARASKRLGAYLPEWVFTRAMFAITFVAVVLMLLLPGLVSIFLLVAGGLMVLFGAVVYSDTMLASRWLPGRTTPQHVLLFGVAILMMGVLLGIIAK